MVADWEFSYNSLTFGGGQDIGVLNVEGLGPTDIREDTVVRAGHHGAFTHAQLYEPRRIVFTLDCSGTDIDDTLDNVDLLRTAMLPHTSDAQLAFKLPNDVEKMIWCVPRRLFIPYDTALNLGLANAISLEMIAGDPFIYSSAQSQDLNNAAASISTIANAGNIDSPHMSAIITGPGTTFTIQDDADTTKKLVVNTTLTGGQTMTIDWRQRTIVRSGGVNLYSSLSADSVWWELEPGNTSVEFLVGSGSTGATEMDFTWRSAWM